jgi:hypothetical protein
MAKLDGLLAFDASVNMTRFAWLKAMPVAPKADHVRELLDRLRQVRDIGLQPDLSTRIHEERLRQFIRLAANGLYFVGSVLSVKSK